MSSNSPPAGLHCNSSVRPAPRWRTSPMSVTAPVLRLPSHARPIWQGRAAEMLGKPNDARTHYKSAAGYSTVYYGQLARARLGLKDLVIRPPPNPAQAQKDVVARDRDPLRHWRARPHCREASPSSGNGPRTRRRSQRLAKPPPVRKTHALWCCSVELRSRAGFRSSNLHSLLSEFRSIAPSGLGLSRELSMPSRVRRAASIHALFQAQVP